MNRVCVCVCVKLPCWYWSFQVTRYPVDLSPSLRRMLFIGLWISLWLDPYLCLWLDFVLYAVSRLMFFCDFSVWIFFNLSNSILCKTMARSLLLSVQITYVASVRLSTNVSIGFIVISVVGEAERMIWNCFVNHITFVICGFARHSSDPFRPRPFVRLRNHHRG